VRGTVRRVQTESSLSPNPTGQVYTESHNSPPAPFPMEQQQAARPWGPGQQTLTALFPA